MDVVPAENKIKAIAEESSDESDSWWVIGFCLKSNVLISNEGYSSTRFILDNFFWNIELVIINLGFVNLSWFFKFVSDIELGIIWQIFPEYSIPKKEIQKSILLDNNRDTTSLMYVLKIMLFDLNQNNLFQSLQKLEQFF